ncbi:hypothetical protein SPD53_18035 [Oceanobacillus sp. MO10714A]
MNGNQDWSNFSLQLAEIVGYFLCKLFSMVKITKKPNDYGQLDLFPT